MESTFIRWNAVLTAESYERAARHIAASPVDLSRATCDRRVGPSRNQSLRGVEVSMCALICERDVIDIRSDGFPASLQQAVLAEPQHDM
jgi:hypothetical protein